MISKNVKSEDFIYQSLSAANLTNNYAQIEVIIKKFTEYIKTKKNIDLDLYCNIPVFYDIFERIDERRDYFQYFHSDKDRITIMSQAKETGLLCYWIVKYKPLCFKNFYDEEDFYLKNNHSINEEFAVFIMESFVKSVNESGSFFFNEHNKENFIYSLHNRDLSKEALQLFMDAFVKEQTEE